MIQYRHRNLISRCLAQNDIWLKNQSPAKGYINESFCVDAGSFEIVEFGKFLLTLNLLFCTTIVRLEFVVACKGFIFLAKDLFKKSPNDRVNVVYGCSNTFEYGQRGHKYGEFCQKSPIEFGKLDYYLVEGCTCEGLQINNSSLFYFWRNVKHHSR